jgi:hypothetical protein
VKRAARTARAARILACDQRIPKPLRWGAVVGLLPIPGPIDEAVLVVVGGVLWLFYRDRFAVAWQQADEAASAY